MSIAWLKLLLVPLSIVLASLAARTFGHAVGGVLAGLPVIAAPLVAVLLIDQPAAAVAVTARATIVSIPAALAFIVVYAWLATVARWALCLAGSTVAFIAVGWAVSVPTNHALWASDSLRVALALLAPAIALAIMPRTQALSGPVPIPRSELALRATAGALVGAAILYGADHFGSRVNGLLLAWPISGSVLPSMTLPIHGRVATLNLLRGFANGLIGFAVFFTSLHALLAAEAGKLTAFAVALAAAVTTAAIVYRWRTRQGADAGMNPRK